MPGTPHSTTSAFTVTETTVVVGGGGNGGNILIIQGQMDIREMVVLVDHHRCNLELSQLVVD